MPPSRLDSTDKLLSIGFSLGLEGLVRITELSMGRLCVTQSNPTHYNWKNLDPTRPNPKQLTIELTV